jgi:hypothetical protein
MVLFLSNDNNEAMAISTAKSTVAKEPVPDEVLKSQLAADPTLATRMNQIESFTQNAMLTGRLVNGKVEIPVVVNVLYRTASENISDAQIQSQIDVLNQDFNVANSISLALLLNSLSSCKWESLSF